LEYKNFILDLSDTLFLDSTFLGSIVFFLKQVNAIGGSLRLVINSNKVTIISQVQNIKNITDIFSSVDEAIVNL